MRKQIEATPNRPVGAENGSSIRAHLVGSHASSLNIRPQERFWWNFSTKYEQPDAPARSATRLALTCVGSPHTRGAERDRASGPRRLQVRKRIEHTTHFWTSWCGNWIEPQGDFGPNGAETGSRIIGGFGGSLSIRSGHLVVRRRWGNKQGLDQEAGRSVR